jgi:hypothetical protein
MCAALSFQKMVLRGFRLKVEYENNIRCMHASVAGALFQKRILLSTLEMHA